MRQWIMKYFSTDELRWRPWAALVHYGEEKAECKSEMFSAPNLEEVAGEREALAFLLGCCQVTAYKAARL